MKIVKITSLGCPSCIIMNKIMKEIEAQYSQIQYEVLDYDFDDDVSKYNPGNILPILIFIKNDKEINRLVGEHKKEEIIKIIKEVYEKDNESNNEKINK